MPPEGDPIFGARDLYGVYEALSPGFRGRCTAPLLVDARGRRAVSNESAGIVRALGELGAARALAGATGVDLYPQHLRAEIDGLNDWVRYTDDGWWFDGGGGGG